MRERPMEGPQDYADQSHLPPQDLEAEEALLGAMMLSEKACETVEQVGVEAGMFYRPSHRFVFEAIQALRARTGQHDEMLVIDELRATDGGKQRNEQGQLEQVTALAVAGGAAAVMTLAERVPAVANARAYAEAVVEAATNRRLVEVGHAVAKAGYDPTMRSDDAVRYAEQQLLDVVAATGEKHRRGWAIDTDSSLEAWSATYQRYHDDQALLEAETLSWGRPELDERLGRMRPGQLFVPAGWTKHGKEQSVDSPVLTPSGWTTMGALKVGDQVIAADGSPTQVVGVYPQGVKQTYHVHTADGAVVNAGADHLWTVEDRRGVERTVTTLELMDKPRTYLPRIEPVQHPQADLPLDPYVVGALLGDGGLTGSVRFSTADPDLLTEMRRLLPASRIRHVGRYDYSITGIAPAIRELGMRCPAWEKRVPARYLTASAEQRLAVLQGLLDTDGWVEQRCWVRFGSTSRGLAEDVRQLVLSLGGNAVVTDKAPGRYTHNGEKRVGRPSFVVSIAMPVGVRLFRLERKELPASMRSKPWLRRRIVAVTPSEATECVCIAVDHPRHLYLTRDYVPTHNTWFVLDVAEAAMQQGARVLIDSGEMSDAELVERWIAMGGHDYTAVQEARVPWSVMRDRVDVMRKWKRRTLTGRMSLERLRSQVSKAKLEGDPYRLVVVDHLGLVRPAPGGARHGRTEFLEDAVAELKAMAEEYGFTLLLVCQLSRPPFEKDAHPRYLRPPIQSDLKGASGIEQIATSVIFVYRRMVKETGRFNEQSSVLLFPFHRSRQVPKPIACEFVLPSMRPTGSPISAYRFMPVTVEAPEPSPAIQAVQESLEGTFGPVTLAQDRNDDIPF